MRRVGIRCEKHVLCVDLASVRLDDPSRLKPLDPRHRRAGLQVEPDVIVTLALEQVLEQGRDELVRPELGRLGLVHGC